MRVSPLQKWAKSCRSAFSLIEVLIVVAILGILAGIAVVTLPNLKVNAESAKLNKDVATLNQSIQVYLQNGGDLSSATTPAEILTTLKSFSVQANAAKKTFVGLTGSMVDLRLAARPTDASYQGARAVFNSSTNRFEISTDTSQAGVRSFFLTEDPEVPTAETRADSTVKYAEDSDWVWDYEDSQVNYANVSTSNTGFVPSPRVTPAGNGNPNPNPNRRGAGPPGLLPPNFSIVTGDYPPGDFALSLTLTNPNTDPSLSKIVWGKVTPSGIVWQDYTGTIQVNEDDEIVAYTETLDPTQYLSSGPRSEQYRAALPLSPPGIDGPSEVLVGKTANFTFDNTANEAAYPGLVGDFEIQYRYVSATNGTASPWTAIAPGVNAPFDSNLYPDGATVEAKVVSISGSFGDSPIATKNVNIVTSLPLHPPTIHGASEVNARGTASIYFRNLQNETDYPNDIPDFQIQYRFIPLGAGTATPWTNINSSTITYLSGPAYPDGAIVEAKVISISGNYTESPVVTKTITSFNQLLPPAITYVHIDRFTPNHTVEWTVTDVNTEPFSSLVYKIRDLATGTETAYASYSGPVSVLMSDYPQGVRIIAKAVSSEPTWRDSTESKNSKYPGFFNLPIENEVVFVLDSSGSMSSQGRLDSVKDAVSDIITTFDPTQGAFGIVDYDSTATVIAGYSPATQAHKDASTSAVNAVTAGGGTHYVNALTAALPLVQAGAKQVIFLSDGHPNPSMPTEQIAGVQALLAAGAIRFDTIAFGSAATQALQDMANSGGGVSVVIND